MSDPQQLTATIDSADWHFWSTDPTEKDLYTTQGYAWFDEAGFYAPKESALTVPVHRFYSKSRNHHFWTISRSELEGRGDFVYEGPKYYVFDMSKPQPAGTRPLARFNAKPQVGDFFHHFWSPHPENELLGEWKPEGHIGFVYDTDPNLPDSTELVHRYNARPITGNWHCSVQYFDDRQKTWFEAYGENYENITGQQAVYRCNDYVRFVSGQDKRRLRPQVVPR